MVTPSVGTTSVFVVRDLSVIQRVRCSCQLSLLLLMRLGAIRDAGSNLWKDASRHGCVQLADAYWEMLVNVMERTEEGNGV